MIHCLPGGRLFSRQSARFPSRERYRAVEIERKTVVDTRFDLKYHFYWPSSLSAVSGLNKMFILDGDSKHDRHVPARKLYFSCDRYVQPTRCNLLVPDTIKGAPLAVRAATKPCHHANSPSKYPARSGYY